MTMTSPKLNSARSRLFLVAVSLLAAVSGFAIWEFGQRIREARAKTAAHQHLENLFDRALGFGPDLKSSASSEQAVHEIGAYPGQETENMLLDLATREPIVALSNVPAQAVEELARRNDPAVPVVLAGLMQRQTLFATRKAVAEALGTLPCNARCASELLDYLDQIHSGDLNYEDEGLDVYPPDLAAYVKRKNNESQQEIYEMLFKDLLRQPATTNAVLADKYGLGSMNPQSFAIVFALLSNDKEACPGLAQSVTKIESDREHSRSDLLKKLKQTEEALRCFR